VLEKVEWRNFVFLSRARIITEVSSAGLRVFVFMEQPLYGAISLPFPKDMYSPLSCPLVDTLSLMTVHFPHRLYQFPCHTCVLSSPPAPQLKLNTTAEIVHVVP
jgi:hypothetical protein